MNDTQFHFTQFFWCYSVLVYTIVVFIAELINAKENFHTHSYAQLALIVHTNKKIHHCDALNQRKHHELAV